MADYHWQTATGGCRLNSNTDKVGVGLTTPSAKLEVHEASADVRVNVSSGASNSHAGLSLKNDSRSWLLQNQGSDGDKLYFFDETAAAIRMSIDSSGRVGIGTNAPATNLHVNGHIGIGKNDRLYLDIDEATKNTYLSYDGSSIKLVKNGAVVATW